MQAQAELDLKRPSAGPVHGRIPWNRVIRWAALALAALFFATSLAAYLTDAVVHTGAVLTWYDLNVYNDAGLIVRQLPSILYSWQLGLAAKFTYTPFAALIFAAGTFMPWNALHWLMTSASLVAIPLTAWLTIGGLGRRGTPRMAAAFAVGAIALWTEPVAKALQLGQIEPLLLLLIVFDLTRPDHTPWKGAGIGIAAGIKLIPLLFIPYLLLSGKFRQAAVAAGAFAATIGVGFAVLPGASASYFLTGYFLDPGRTGGVISLVNQSLLGSLARLMGSTQAASPVWLGMAIAVAVLGLAAGAALTRTGRPVHGWILVGLTSVLVSPISWDHHWVWIVPLIALLAGIAIAQQGWTRWASLVAVVAIAAAYGAWPWHYTGQDALVPDRGLLAWAVKPPQIFQVTTLHGWQLLTWNLFVAVGTVLYLGMIAFAALTWWRRPRRPEPPTPPPAADTEALLARADAVLAGLSQPAA